MSDNISFARNLVKGRIAETVFAHQGDISALTDIDSSSQIEYLQILKDFEKS